MDERILVVGEPTLVHRFKWNANTELQLSVIDLLHLQRAVGMSFSIVDEQFQTLPEALQEKIKPHEKVEKTLWVG